MGEIIVDDSLRERLHVFRDRYHAGKLLADMLKRHISLEDSVLLAIPAGGIPVGYEISRTLDLPMDLSLIHI